MESNEKSKLGKTEFEKILNQCKEQVAQEWLDSAGGVIDDVTNSHLFLEVINKFVSEYKEKIEKAKTKSSPDYEKAVEEIFNAVNYFEDQVVESILSRFKLDASKEEENQVLENLKDIPFFLSDKTVGAWKTNALRVVRSGDQGKLKEFKAFLKGLIKKDLNDLNDLLANSGNMYMRGDLNIVKQYSEFMKSAKEPAELFNQFKKDIKHKKTMIDYKGAVDKIDGQLSSWKKILAEKQKEMNSVKNWFLWTVALLSIVGAYYSYAESKEYKAVKDWLKKIDDYSERAKNISQQIGPEERTDLIHESTEELKKDVDEAGQELLLKFKKCEL